MFEVPHNHHGKDFKRFFSPGRSSMSAIEDKRAEEFRKHVWAVTMIDDDPLSGKTNRHSTGFGRRGPNKLRSKRASAYAGPPPVKPETEKSKDEPKPSRPMMKEPTVTVQPKHPPSFVRSPTDLYPVKEDTTIHRLMTNDKTSTPINHNLPRTLFPTHPTYAVLEAPEFDPRRSKDALPAAKLNRPRKLSNNSATATMSTFQSRENMSMSSAKRSPSWGNRTSVDTSDSFAAHWRPDYLYQRPMPLKKQAPVRAALKPNEMFAMLPVEVLSLILEKLRELHLGNKSESCSTCWMRDVTNICVASRKWFEAAQTALYKDIQLVGPDSAAHKKKFKLAQGARVMMLRRVLRSKPQIAAIVRRLKVPAFDALAKGGTCMADYDSLVASLVMACPNLESLSGMATTYDHAFKKIFHALSTRSNLKEMNWRIQPSPHSKQQRIQSSTQQLGLVMPGELKPFQEAAFLSHHDNWSRLETLSIHCLPGATLTPEGLLTSTLSYLPNLKHLHLCSLPPNSFSDTTLLALPPLHTLTLSDITGITSNGLSAFATHASGLPLRKLTLRHTPLTSLATLARILSNLRSLVNFSLVQSSPPVMPEDDTFALWMMPYLASSSVRKLHWDITGHALCVNATDDILARSIAAGGFPALRILRVLNDPDGIFQELCYPVERIDLPTDRFKHAEQQQSDISASTGSNSPISPARLFKSSSSNSPPPRAPMSTFLDARYSPFTNLRSARLAAQSRLEAARSRPRFTINVVDEDGTTTDTFALAGFIGTPGSPIKYHLLSDRGAADDKGGLVDVRDLDGDGGESLADGREGCTGRWNMRDGVVADRKEKEKWWHTERGRWTKTTL